MKAALLCLLLLAPPEDDPQERAMVLLFSRAADKVKTYPLQIRKTTNRSLKKKWAQEMDQVKKEQAVFVSTETSPDQLKVGFVGAPDITHMVVKQVVDPDTAIMALVLERTTTNTIIGAGTFRSSENLIYESKEVLLENYPTAELATKQKIVFNSKDQLPPVLYAHSVSQEPIAGMLRMRVVDQPKGVAFLRK